MQCFSVGLYPSVVIYVSSHDGHLCSVLIQRKLEEYAGSYQNIKLIQEHNSSFWFLNFKVHPFLKLKSKKTNPTSDKLYTLMRSTDVIFKLNSTFVLHFGYSG